MYLIVNEVMQLEVVHIAYCYKAVELLAGSSVYKLRLRFLCHRYLREVDAGAVLAFILGSLSFRHCEHLSDICFVRTVKYGSHHLPAECLCGIAEVNFKNLSDIHSGRNAERVQYDIERSTVGQERHILLMQYAGNDTLVSVTTRHFIADRDLSLLRNVAAHCHIDTCRELVAVLSCEYLYVNYYAAFAMRNTQRTVTHFPCLLAEDRTKKSFFRGKLGLALGSDLSDKDIAGMNFRTNSDYTVLVEILECIVAQVRDIPCDLFRSELCITAFELVLFYMDRCVNIIVNQFLVDENSILVVVAFPCHEADKSVLTERNLALACSGTVCEYLSCLYLIALVYDRTLVHAGTLVGALELDELVLCIFAVCVSYIDLVCGNTGNNAVFLCKNTYSGVNGSLVFHTGADDRVLCNHERYCLSLHVRTHKSTVRVIVLKERYHSSSHGNDHLRRNIHIIDFFGSYFDDLVSASCGNALSFELAVLVERFVSLRYSVKILDIGGHINYLVKHFACSVLYLAVRSLNKAVLVDARKGCKI